MMRLIFCIAFIVFIILQNVVHELGHVIFAKYLEIKVREIQWFTASKLGGSKVCYENEPEIDEDVIEKKWGIAALGGFLATLSVGYILTVIYYIFRNLNSPIYVIIICAGSMVFLISDLVYFILGCIFRFGDIVGVMKVFKIGRLTALFVLVVMLITNISIIKFLWY